MAEGNSSQEENKGNRRGFKKRFIETIQDPKETLDLIPRIIYSATEEILMISSR